MKKLILSLALIFQQVISENAYQGTELVLEHLSEYFQEFFYKNNNIHNLKLRPVPWLTEEAIAFLEKYFCEHDNPRILEFGSGASTLWFAHRTKNLVSVEHNPEWHGKIKLILESTKLTFAVNYNLIPLPYYTFCNNFPDNYFDLILVDGRNRKACILKAIRILKPGGILMLDNAERPYYHCVFHNLDSWQTTITQQTKPDSCGFWYKGWITRWWFKPKQTDCI